MNAHQSSCEKVKLMFELQPERKATCLALRDRNGDSILHRAMLFNFVHIAKYLVEV